MGRKKIKIEKIEEGRNRQVTFLKRKAGLFKKAYELATLTDSQVGVIVFGHNGRLSQFCSTDMDAMLLRYTEFEGKIDSKGPEDFGKDEDEDDDGDDAPDDTPRGPPGAGSGGSSSRNEDGNGQGSGPSSHHAGPGSQSQQQDSSSGSGQGSGGSAGGKRKGYSADIKSEVTDSDALAKTSPSSSPMDKAAIRAAVQRRQRRNQRSTSSSASGSTAQISTDFASMNGDFRGLSQTPAQPVMPRPSTSTAVMGTHHQQQQLYQPMPHGISARTMSGSHLPPMAHQHAYQPNGLPYDPSSIDSSAWQSHSVPHSRSTSSHPSPAPVFPPLLRPTTADGAAMNQMSSYASHFPPPEHPSPLPGQHLHSQAVLPESALHPRGLGSARISTTQAHSYFPAPQAGLSRPLLSVMPPTNDTYASLARSTPASASSESVAGPFSLTRNASFEYTPSSVSLTASNAGTPPLHHTTTSGNLSTTSSEQSIKDLLAGSAGPPFQPGQAYPMGPTEGPMSSMGPASAPRDQYQQQQLPPHFPATQPLHPHQHSLPQLQGSNIKAEPTFSLGFGMPQSDQAANAPYFFSGGMPMQ